MCVDIFLILALVSTILPITMPWPMEFLGNQVCVGRCSTPIDSHTEL